LNKIKIAVISDIHAGKRLPTRPGEQAWALLDEFVGKINETFKPDIVAELGDRINSESNEIDAEHEKTVCRILNNLNVPWIPILGNHDIEKLSKDDNEKIFRCPMGNTSRIINGFQLIFLNAQDPVIKNVGGNISDEGLAWLKNKLEKLMIPTLIFCHQALDDQTVSDNIHFKKIPQLAFVKNKTDVRKIINDSGNVIGVINGHLHWSNTCSENGTAYVSIPSFIECWEEGYNAPGLFSMINIEGTNIETINISLRPFTILSRTLI
jgi:predicted phosphodiesterase